MGKRKGEIVYQPAAGVFTDFENLLQKFSDTDTVRYEKFSEIWREMNMSYLFAGRQNEREAHEFVEECFKIALRFWLPPYNFQVRVGGLYLLYGLYLIQPVIQRARIRVTLEDWKNILIFQSEAHQQQHYDVDFVFQKLRLGNAFDFVMTETERYPSMRDSKLEDTSIPDEFKEETSVLYDLFSSDVLEQFSTLHQHYHKVKVGLEGPDAECPSRSLDVINSDLISGLTHAISHYQERRKSHSQHTRKITLKSESDEENYTSTVDDNTDSTYRPGKDSTSKKHKLKAKAYRQIAKAHKSRRHRQATKENALQNSKHSKSKSPSKDESSELTTDPNTSTATEDEEMTTEQSSTIMSMPRLIDEKEESTPKGKKRRKKVSDDKATPPKKKVKKVKANPEVTDSSPNIIATETENDSQNETLSTKDSKKTKKHKKKTEKIQIEIVNDDLQDDIFTPALPTPEKETETDTLSPTVKKKQRKKDSKNESTGSKRKKEKIQIEIVNDDTTSQTLQAPENNEAGKTSPKGKKKQKKKDNKKESAGSKKKKEKIEIEIVNDELDNDGTSQTLQSPKKTNEIANTVEISLKGKKKRQKKNERKDATPSKKKKPSPKKKASLHVKIPNPRKRKS